MHNSHSKHLLVTQEHIDFNKHVNNLIYLQWGLEITREHWLSATEAAYEERYFWFVRSHHIEYLKQAFLGEKIVLTTFVESMRGPFSERIVHISKSEEVIVKIRSNWCLLDKATQKLVRVPDEIKQLFI